MVCLVMPEGPVTEERRWAMFCWDMVRLRVDSAFICEEESEDVSGVRVNNGWFFMCVGLQRDGR